MTEKTETRFPLFYRQPELLTAARHADLSLRPAAGYGFAQHANAIPLTIIEFGAAMRHYPIVFAAGDGFPVAILGLDRSNGFVDGDAWAPDCYVPAYARRYPFVFVDRSQDSFVLAIDRAAPHFAPSNGGQPLFLDGKPTELVENVLAFCRDFHGAHIQTDAFIEALMAQDLLVDQHADARLNSGHALMLSGFKVVDRARFDALSDPIILDWHRKGWLALVHFHFLSLDRFADLLVHAEKNTASAEASPETEDA